MIRYIVKEIHYGYEENWESEIASFNDYVEANIFSDQYYGDTYVAQESDD